MAKRVLVIGGTQFMGRLLVEALVKDGFDVSVLNRGLTPSPFAADVVTHLKADRLNDRPGFRRVLKDTGSWLAVVDFVAFQEFHISDVVEGLRETAKKRKSDTTGQLCFRTKHYIFVSSDSLFVGCRPSERNRTEEDMKMLPVEELKMVEQQEPYQITYGRGKLACEQMLAQAFARWQFPFVVLRLPDVIGPYDNLGCHLQLQTAVINEESIGVKCSSPGLSGRTHKASVAFAPDIIRVILSFVSPPSSKASLSSLGQTFHVCCDESITLESYVKAICSALSRGDGGEEVIVPRISVKKRAPFLCVNIGPLDNSKLKQYLPTWVPTPLEQAIQSTTDWYLTPQNALYTLQLSQDENQ